MTVASNMVEVDREVACGTQNHSQVARGLSTVGPEEEPVAQSDHIGERLPGNCLGAGRYLTGTRRPPNLYVVCFQLCVQNALSFSSTRCSKKIVLLRHCL